MTATQWPRVPLAVVSTPSIRLAVEVLDEELRKMNIAFLGVSECVRGTAVTLDKLAVALERAAEREYLKRHTLACPAPLARHACGRNGRTG
jgi:hypothetical protein